MPRIKSSSWVWFALFAAWLIAGLFVPRAHATILFAGGEDVDFVFTGTVTPTTTAGQFRAGFARLALGAGGSVTDPPSNRFQTPTFANTTSLWLHTETIIGSVLTTTNDQAVGVYGSGGVRRLMLRATGTNGQVKISKRTAAGVFTDLVTCTLGGWPVASLTTLDWFINYAVAGEVTLYAGGVQICDFSGDVTTDGVTTLSAFDFASPLTGVALSFSEIIVSTTDTRSLNLFTCQPVANGVNQTWTGNQTNVNGTTANDSTPLTTGSSAQTAEFTCPSLPAGAFSVAAVKQIGRVLKGASGPANFRFIARPSSGSTDFDSGSDIGLTTNFTNYPFYWATNPACSCAWTTNDVTTGVNFGVISKP